MKYLLVHMLMMVRFCVIACQESHLTGWFPHDLLPSWTYALRRQPPRSPDLSRCQRRRATYFHHVIPHHRRVLFRSTCYHDHPYTPEFMPASAPRSRGRYTGLAEPLLAFGKRHGAVELRSNQSLIFRYGMDEHHALHLTIGISLKPSSSSLIRVFSPSLQY